MEKQELHIDFEAAKAAFETYLDEYDRTDDKIHLKIVHTYCVVECAEKIATRMHLGQEDVQLAKIIGLLHDIGRLSRSGDSTVLSREPWIMRCMAQSCFSDRRK